MLNRGVLLLQPDYATWKTDDGSHCADFTWREIRQRKCCPLLQTMQQQKKRTAPDGMGAVSQQTEIRGKSELRLAARGFDETVNSSILYAIPGTTCEPFAHAISHGLKMSLNFRVPAFQQSPGRSHFFRALKRQYPELFYGQDHHTF